MARRTEKPKSAETALFWLRMIFVRCAAPMSATAALVKAAPWRAAATVAAAAPWDPSSASRSCALGLYVTTSGAAPPSSR